MTSPETVQRDYYETLGLGKTATPEAIKDAFRKLAMKYHPDRNKAPDAENRFKEIAEAYAVLSDPAKRADYDAKGFAAVGDVSQQDFYSNINFDDLFGGLNLDFGHFGSFFGHKRSRPQQGANIEVNLKVSLERIANGGNETLKLSRPAICSTCQGTGAKGRHPPRKCDTCGGSGRVSSSTRKDKEHVFIQQISTCPVCKGHGQIIEHPCPECHGSGQGSRHETLSIKIPRGAEEGMALRISGKGMPAPENRGNPGDLFVIVHTDDDPRFERNGKDLHHRQTIMVTDAVLGTKLDVETLNGSARVTVPPGTQPESILRLKGKGLPEFGSERHGDMYLQLSVKIPTTLSAEEHKLYERLRVLAKNRHN
jgi:molecular chaperone DnaJ